MNIYKYIEIYIYMKIMGIYILIEIYGSIHIKTDRMWWIVNKTCKD